MGAAAALSRGAGRGRIRPGMSTAARLAVYATLSGVWLSGAVWLLLHFAFARPGAFGLLRNPLEPECLAVHGAFAFAALVLVGWLWAGHWPSGWQSRRSRISGVAMVAGIGLLCVSGYLLYYLGGEGSRTAASELHWGIGLVMPGAFAAHLQIGTGRRGRTQSRIP